MTDSEDNNFTPIRCVKCDIIVFGEKPCNVDVENLTEHAICSKCIRIMIADDEEHAGKSFNQAFNDARVYPGG